MSDKLGLHAKIALIMGDVSRIPKSNHNKQQNYDYASHSDIADTIRAKLSEHKLVIFPSCDGYTQESITSRNGATGYHTLVNVTYTIVCADTGESMVCHWEGESDDYGDKGLGKAFTYAQKSFLLNFFVLSTGDPTDDTDSGNEPAAHRQKKGSPKGKTTSPAHDTAQDDPPPADDEFPTIRSLWPQFTSQQLDRAPGQMKLSAFAIHGKDESIIKGLGYTDWNQCKSVLGIGSSHDAETLGHLLNDIILHAPKLADLQKAS